MTITQTKRRGFLLLFLGFATGIPGVWLLLAPDRYEATTQIELNTVSDPNDMTYSPFFLQTEWEILKSDPVLGKTVEDLHLNEEWGKRYNNGHKLETSDSIRLLKRNFSLMPIRNTRLVDISVISEVPAEAAIIANTIATNYFAYRAQFYKEEVKQAGAAAQGHVPPPVTGNIVESAQTPTIPINSNRTTGKALLFAGLFVILAGVRLLRRAYFAAQ